MQRDELLVQIYTDVDSSCFDNEGREGLERVLDRAMKTARALNDVPTQAEPDDSRLMAKKNGVAHTTPNEQRTRKTANEITFAASRWFAASAPSSSPAPAFLPLLAISTMMERKDCLASSLAQIQTYP